MPHHGDLDYDALIALGFLDLAAALAAGLLNEAAAIAAAFCRIATGQYTGDGAISLGIVGIGFRPRMVIIWPYGVAAIWNTTWQLKSDTMAAALCFEQGAGANTAALNNRIISLDADGFTVDDAAVDAHPNTLNQVYDYVVWG